MPDFPHPISMNNEQPSSSSWTMLMLLTGVVAVTVPLLIRLEAKNQLNYDNFFVRAFAGLLAVLVQFFHARPEDLDEVAESSGKLFALGPHRTGIEGIAFASRLRGAPPHFLVTDSFPIVAPLLRMFKVIPVAFKAAKNGQRSANSTSIETANQILRAQGCVAMFPQGDFAKIGEEPPFIYSGIAKMALQSRVPIHVIRLDGLWSIQNPYIPLIVRNNRVYRALLSAFHLNDVRTTLCSVIDFHLKADEADKEVNLEEREEDISEICAQLYAFYRHTEELTPADLVHIKKEIAEGDHRAIWKAKVESHAAKKQPLKPQIEEAIAEPTSAAMSIG